MAEGTEGTDDSGKTTTPVVEGNPNTEVKQPQTVPLHEHIGVKEMLRKAEGKTADAEKSHAETRHELSNVQEALESSDKRVKALEAELKSLEESKKSLVDPEKHQELVDKIATLEKGILDSRKKALTDAGVSEEEIKDLTEEQLTIYEKAVKAIGAGAKKSLPDGGKGGSGSSENLTSAEKISQGLADKFKDK